MGGTRMKTRYLIIYLGKKIYIFQSILTGIWVISQPGDVRSLIWFDHITCPQFSSIPFLHSEIPQDFLLEKTGKISQLHCTFSGGSPYKGKKNRDGK